MWFSERRWPPIEINFKANNSAANVIPPESIQNIIVNVSGVGINGEIFNARECHDANVVCDSISVPRVPAGQRLVQLLVVAENQASGDSVIYYGDVQQLIDGDTQLRISMRERGTFSSQAQLVGHYKPKSGHVAADKRLTGRVDVEVVTDPGKPDMKIGEVEMFGGKFHLFTLDSVAFKYRFTGWDQNSSFYSDIEIFQDVHGGNGFTISSFPANGKKVITFDSNEQVREERNNVYSLRDFEKKIVAFLGDSVFQACYDPTNGVYNGQAGSDSICTLNESSCTDYLEISDLIISAGADSCSGSDYRLVIKNIDDREKFYSHPGPFWRNSLDASAEALHVDSTTISWDVLDFYNVDSFDVFTIDDASFNDENIKIRGTGDGVECNALVSEGFSGPKQASQITSPFNAIRYKYDLSSSEVVAKNANRLKVVICPKDQNGKYYKSAFYYRGDNSSSATPTPTKAVISRHPYIDSGSTFFYRGVCTPMLIKLQDD
ncbi:MAG: hypothetical protein HRT44_06825 [Bdellovibrionales bacterium]|nr:hypothetical protein [Bdellovibrionales bacterium]NQZ18952.1 hypothetical protein [Bdellovibrionales bacterium]